MVGCYPKPVDLTVKSLSLPQSMTAKRDRLMTNYGAGSSFMNTKCLLSFSWRLGPVSGRGLMTLRQIVIEQGWRAD